MKLSETELDAELGEFENWGEAERSLFRAGRERAPEKTRAAVLGALGLGDGPGPNGGPDGGTTGRALRPASPAPSMAPAVAAPTRSTATQWLVGGLMAVALPAAWLLFSRAEPVEPRTPVAAQEPAATQEPLNVAQRVDPAATTAQDAAATPADAAPVAEPLEARDRAPSTPAKGASPQGPNAKPEAPAGGASTLAEELAMIRKARSALSEGRAAEALGTLDEYSSRFRKPQLAHEAAMVRIEALVKSGRREEARRVAAPLIASGSVHAARARSLVEGSN